MNSAMKNEYEQLSPELPACFQIFIHDRLVGLNIALTVSWFAVSFVESTLTVNDDFMCISRLDFQPLEEVPIVFSS